MKRVVIPGLNLSEMCKTLLFSSGVGESSLSSGVVFGNRSEHYSHLRNMRGKLSSPHDSLVITNCQTPRPGAQDPHIMNINDRKMADSTRLVDEQH